jgi:hypothetical protein
LSNSFCGLILELTIEKEFGKLLNGKKEHIHHVDLDKSSNSRKKSIVVSEKRTCRNPQPTGFNSFRINQR